jgi:hypothetical protein
MRGAPQGALVSISTFSDGLYSINRQTPAMPKQRALRRAPSSDPTSSGHLPPQGGKGRAFVRRIYLMYKGNSACVHALARLRGEGEGHRR